MISLGLKICFGFDKVLVSFTENLSKFELIDPFGVFIEEDLSFEVGTKFILGFIVKFWNFESSDPFCVLIEEALKVTGDTLSRLESEVWESLWEGSYLI